MFTILASQNVLILTYTTISVMDQSSLCTDHDTLSYMGMAACYHWEFFQGYRGNGSQDCM